MSNRIRSNNVQVGESFVIGKKGSEKEKILTPEEKEILQKKQQIEELNKQLEIMLQDAKLKGKEIIDGAQLEAARIIKGAEEEIKKRIEEAEALKQQAIEQGIAEGFQQGYDDALKQGQEEVLARTQGIDRLTGAMLEVKKEIFYSAEKEIIELATFIAEKVIRTKLTKESEIIKEVVKAAIAQLKDREEIKIFINPALSKTLYEFAEELKDTFRNLGSVKIVEDKTVPADGAIVESPESRIDARLQTQLSEIMKNMLDELAEKKHTEDVSQEIEIRIEEKLQEDT